MSETISKVEITKYEVVIGLEIHAQISSKTKMFCGCSADYFGKEANTNVCPICMGFPGQLPVINQEAVHKGIKAAMALGCEIAEFSQFDRKNYFYPDLPKGFQISQFDHPISKNGQIEITVQVNVGGNSEGKVKVIRITRLHLEDDAGKLTHVQGGSLIDYNRSGIGLMEIVSEPDLSSPEEAVLYAKAIQNILRYTEASDADMEKGMMRFDASVSLRPKGETKLYPRAEIKNLNSFRSLETAIKFEIKRQTELWDAGTPPEKDTTVGYDDVTFKTYFLRNKEGADDYRYFPEPDLPPLVFEKEFVESLKKDLPELPELRYARYVGEFKLSEAEALFLIEDKQLSDYFDVVVKTCNDPKKASSFVLSILLGLVKKNDLIFADIKIKPEAIGRLIALVNKGDLSMNIAKGELFEIMFEKGSEPEEIIEEKGYKSMNNSADLEAICQKIVMANEKSVTDYKGGKEQAFQFLVGQVMKETKGQANAEMVREILLKNINN